MKPLIVIVLVAVLGALGSAGFFMLRSKHGPDDDPRGQRMARALALRIALSVALFLFILLAWSLGWIQPTGFPAGS